LTVPLLIKSWYTLSSNAAAMSDNGESDVAIPSIRSEAKASASGVGDGEIDGDGDAFGLRLEMDGVAEKDGLTLVDAVFDCVLEGDAVLDGELDGETEEDGVTVAEAVTVTEGEMDAVTDWDGDTVPLGVPDGLSEGDTAMPATPGSAVTATGVPL